MAVGDSVGRGVSDGTAVSGVGVSVGDGIASRVGEEQEMRERMQKACTERSRSAESRLVLTTERSVEGIFVAACLCMGGF